MNDQRRPDLATRRRTERLRLALVIATAVFICGFTAWIALIALPETGGYLFIAPLGMLPLLALTILLWRKAVTARRAAE